MKRRAGARRAVDSLCPVWVALALTPTGVGLSVVTMLVAASLLDVPVAGVGGDQLIGGTRPAAVVDVVIVLGAGGLFAFAAPVFALVRSIRAQRYGHQRSRVAIGLSTFLLAAVMALPFVWNPFMTLTVHH